MMLLRKYNYAIKILILIGFVLMVNMVRIDSFAATLEQVDVGLLYGQNNQFPIGVSSTDGFGLYFKDLNGDQVLDFSAYTNLIFYKDGFFDSNRKLIETNESYYSNNQVKGGYHIEIGQGYDSYEAAATVVANLQAKVEQVYLVYDDQWRVFQSAYLTEIEANNALPQIQAVLTDITVTIAQPNDARIIVGTKEAILFAFDSRESEYLFKTTVFTLNDVKYRNSFIIKRLSNSDFTFINRVTMPEYLYGVLPKEASESWPIEALKAQAVASKNFALTIGSKYIAYGFDVDATVNSQVYGGFSVEKPRCNQAVDETNGYALAYQGELIPMYFHSSSGGITDNSENVWSGTLPYLRSTTDFYSLGAPNTDWSAKLNKSDIEAKLIQSGYNVGSLKQVKILSRAESGRVLEFEFVGNLGKATVTKDKIRSVLGASVIKSTLFSFDPNTAITDVAAIKAGAVAQDTNLTVQVNLGENGAMPKVALNIDPTYGVLSNSELSFYQSGAVTNKKVDKNALMASDDIYQTKVQLSKPYLYNSTESFDITDGYVVFYGHGYGHGLGMSQWGAKAMADLGFNYEAILKYYYKDTELIQLH